MLQWYCNGTLIVIIQWKPGVTSIKVLGLTGAHIRRSPDWFHLQLIFYFSYFFQMCGPPNNQKPFPPCWLPPTFLEAIKIEECFVLLIFHLLKRHDMWRNLPQQVHLNFRCFVSSGEFRANVGMGRDVHGSRSDCCPKFYVYPFLWAQLPIGSTLSSNPFCIQRVRRTSHGLYNRNFFFFPRKGTSHGLGKGDNCSYQPHGTHELSKIPANWQTLPARIHMQRERKLTLALVW